jgi:hypothetical protein
MLFWLSLVLWPEIRRIIVEYLNNDFFEYDKKFEPLINEHFRRYGSLIRNAKLLFLEMDMDSLQPTSPFDIFWMIINSKRKYCQWFVWLCVLIIEAYGGYPYGQMVLLYLWNLTTIRTMYYPNQESLEVSNAISWSFYLESKTKCYHHGLVPWEIEHLTPAFFK